MALKLHGIPMSTCTTRVLTCLHEKGLDFELVPVNLFAGEHKQPPFLAKNPFGQIPVLEDGDFTLFGLTVPEFYHLVWLEVESQHYYPAIYQIVYQFFALPLQGKTADQAIIDVNLEKLGTVLDVYEARLGTTKCLAGDFYSLADLHHLSYTYYFMKTPWASLINSRPNVKAWWEDISSRPAFKKVAEGMTFGEK
ncbi:Glutathione S-transferase F13 [Vitis vinifera]|uniref:glutathione transferase n=1 Tax=Vitis vinifera TaxID=29760 RepID=A0A438F4H4_VITVI|nr:Glutathione S-transferase F13 [Vitis vinifera]